MLKNMKLKPKMIGGFVSIALITLIMGFIGYRNQSVIGQHLNEVSRVRLPSIDCLRIIAAQLEAIRVILHTVLNPQISQADFESQFTILDTARAAYREAWSRYEALPHRPEETALWKEFGPLIDDWRMENNRFLDTAKKLGEMDLRNPLALEKTLRGIRGDQYRLEVAVLQAIENNASFEGGEDPAACTLGKWMAGFSTRNKEIARLLDEAKPYHNQLHASVRLIKEKVKMGDQEGARKLFAEEMSPATEKTHAYFDAILVETVRGAELYEKMLHQVMGPIREKQDAALDVLSKIIALNEEFVKTADEESVRLQRRSAVSMIVSVSLGFVAALLLGIVLSLSIVNPIDKTVAAVLKVSEGDMTQQIQIDQKDEVGQLAKAMNLMTGKLRDIVKELAHNSSTLAAASEELSATSTQLASGAEEMNSQSRTVASAGAQLSSNVNTMAASSEEVSSSAGAVASAIEEMSSSINEVAKNCEKESRIARQANEQAVQT
ncbi:MAG: hypothetical protein A2X46_01645, partial [Lentisphaerae bacterium GWF2_57_35]